jgi:aminoglycoside phosphotransferase (APT) family kinase protein
MDGLRGARSDVNRMMSKDRDDLLFQLRCFGLLGADEHPVCQPLAGGVSSDIWKVETARGPICVKKALARLKVSADWYAPVERNACEVHWFETAARIVPKAVPQILGHDEQAGFFVMDYLDPAIYRPWKEELHQGRVDLLVAADVGERLVRIHGGTAGCCDVAHSFDSGTLFHALRLEPYLEATARAHPTLADPLADLVEVTSTVHHRALVHGDISPKNILVGPDGPVFLDAECAWYGDPAFDLAFCLNHFLLKCLWTPDAKDRFLAAFTVMAESYRTLVNWEPVAEVEGRAARLLPGLFLARIDGKSPVEYVTDTLDKERVRRVARNLLLEPVETVDEVACAWARELRS